MKSPKFLKKALLSLLLITVLIIAFAVASSASVRSDARNLLDGVDFDGYTGTTDAESRTYIQENAMLFFSTQKGTDFSTSVKLIEESEGDYAIRLTGAPLFINGDSSGSFNATKYAKSLEFLDLFYTANGPTGFTLSFEMTINDYRDIDSAYKNNLGATTDTSSEPYSPYRGVSLFSFVGFTWPLKVTAVGLPLREAATIDGVEYKKGEVPTGRQNMGYFYSFSQQCDLTSTGSDGIGFTDAKCTTGKATEGSATIGSCISTAAMGDDAIMYELGKPVKVDLVFTRSSTTLSVTAKINGKTVGSRNITSNINNNTGKTFGLRLNDALMNYTLDELKLTVTNCGGDHTGLWADVDTKITEHTDTDGKYIGQSIKRTCNICGVVENIHSNDIYTAEDKISQTTAWYPSSSGEISNFYTDALCGEDTWISFELGVEKLTTETTGKSLFTVYNGEFARPLRLFANGEIRLHSAASASTEVFRPQGSDFRLEEGNNYKFDIYINGETQRYDVYINGELFGSETSDFNKGESATYRLRVSDTGTGTYSVHNMAVYSMVDSSEHNHNYSYKKIAKVTDNELVAYNACYCGASDEKSVISANVKDSAVSNVYNGKGTVEFTAPDGEYWIATDINVRATLDDGALITLGEDIVLELKNGNLLSGATDTEIACASPFTYSTAVKVGMDNSYELYIDGELVAKGSLSGDASSVTLGNDSASDSLRFLYNKIVKLSVTDTPVLPQFIIDESKHTFNHTYNDFKNITVTHNSDGYIEYSYICATCGERLYHVGVDNEIYSAPDGSVSIEDTLGKSFVITDKYITFSRIERFWISLDLTVGALPSNCGSGGKSLLTWWYGKDGYQQMFRLFNGGEIRLKNGDTYKEIADSPRIKVGETYNFAIAVYPATGKYYVYMNGEFFGNAKVTINGGADVVHRLRVGDSGTGTFEYKNVKLASDLGLHIFDQEVVDEKYFAADANCNSGALYYKSCLCGEKGSETFEYGDVYHVYDQSVATSPYLKSSATCKEKAVYYKSCTCGAKGSETFKYGEITGHVFSVQNPIYKNMKSLATCTQKAVYYVSCKFCGASGTETFEYGETLAHVYDREVVDEAYLAVAATESSYALYYKSCACGEVGKETFETAPTIYADYAEGVAGESVTVQVKIAYNPGIVAAYLDVTFDDKRLELISAENGEIFSDFVFGDTMKNGYRLTWDESLGENNVADGTLATLEFRILDSAAIGDAAVNVSVAEAGIIDAALNRVDFATQSGKVKVLNKAEFTQISDAETTVNDNITVFEIKAAYTPETIEIEKYYPLITLSRTDSALDLLYVETSTGAVAVKTDDGVYRPLLLDEGAVVLSGTATAMAVIYDDVHGLVRYYVGEKVPYYAYEGAVILANDVAIYNSDFCDIDEKAAASVVNTTMEGVAVNVRVLDFYNINYSGTAEVVAFQENGITDGIRILSGVDMPWYGLIGFDVETFIDGESQGEYEVSSHNIYSSVIANDKTVYPSEYGFRYFSALAIEEIKVESGKDYYILLKSFTRVGDIKYVGDTVKIIVTENGSYFENTSVLSLDFNTDLSVTEYIDSVEGITLYTSFNGGDITNGKWTYNGKALAFKEELGIFDLEKYRVEFDFCFDSFITASVSSVFSMITDEDGILSSDSNFCIPLRIDSSGKVFNVSTPNETYQLETGKSYKFEAIVNNATGRISVYINNIELSVAAYSQSDFPYRYFRFMDNSKGGSMWIDNFTITNLGTANNVKVVSASEGAYVRGGSYANDVMGTSGGVIEIKIPTLDGLNTDTTRKALLAFDISELEVSKVGYAPLSLTMSNVTDERTFRISLIPSTWSADTVTFNTVPTATSVVAENVKPNMGQPVDLAPYIVEALNTGKTKISVLIEAETATVGQTTVAFTDTQKPYVAVYPEPLKNGYVTKLLSDDIENEAVWDWAQKMYDEWYARYGNLPAVNENISLITSNPAHYTKTNYASSQSTNYDSSKAEYSSRLLSAITDLDEKVSDEFKNAKLDDYGGIMVESLKQKATGKFYSAKLDGRWWIIDPLGYPYISIGLSDIHYSQLGSETQKQNVLAKYETFENWAEATTNRVRDELYFNSSARPVAEIIELDGGLPFIYAPAGVMSSYGYSCGIRDNGSGSTLFTENNTMPVFDPDFEGYAKGWAEKYIVYSDEARLIGYTSDNELPMNEDMLDRSLSVNHLELVNVYTYACAWTWLVNITGKEAPTYADITYELRDLYRGFVWDRYYNVVANAVKEVDPEHMYMGTRFLTTANTSEWVYRFSAQYLDCMTINWYKDWEPSAEALKGIARNGDMPFVVTEFYTKAGDSGLGNTSGAGWYVATQDDRADFYDTFVLRMLESPNCVGWQWFQYMDNDPNSGTGDQSSIDSNKGIVASDLTEYTVLTDRMKALNEKVYMLVDYFAK